MSGTNDQCCMELDAKEQMPPPSDPKPSKEEEKEVLCPKKVTPAVVRTRRLKDVFHSPTDNVMSPFSQKLLGGGAKTKSGPLPHPAILKQKQKPKRLQDPHTDQADSSDQ